MDAYKIAIKLFAEGATKLDARSFVPVFHRWIQAHLLPGHLLIDVADYGHVPAGPGVVLVSSEANIHIDEQNDRTGLLYVRKAPIADAATFADRLRAVLFHAASACALLENEATLPVKPRFSTREMTIRIQDRLLAPNTHEVFQQVRPFIQDAMRQAYDGDHFTLRHHGSAQELFEVGVESTSAPSLNDLIARVTPATVMT